MRALAAQGSFLTMFDKLIPPSENFKRIFDNEDMMGMYNIPDEAACVLKAHLILEELLDLWCSQLTNVEDLFIGIFVPFKTKLVVAKNLGLDSQAYEILNKVNEIRNKFSHRKRHKLERSAVDSLKNKVNAYMPNSEITMCEEFIMEISGVDSLGNRKTFRHDWNSSEVRIQFIIMFVNLMIRLVLWLQNEFKNRGIDYSMLPIKFN